MKPEIFAGFWINKTNSKDLVAMLNYSGICQCCPAWAMLGATLTGGLLKAFWTAFPSDQGRQVLPFVSLWGPGLGWAWYLLCSPLGSSYNFSLTSVSFLSPFWNYNIDPLSWLWEELTGVASLCCPHHCVFVPKAWRAKQSWGLAMAEGGLGMEGKGREKGMDWDRRASGLSAQGSPSSSTVRWSGVIPVLFCMLWKIKMREKQDLEIYEYLEVEWELPCLSAVPTTPCTKDWIWLDTWHCHNALFNMNVMKDVGAIIHHYLGLYAFVILSVFRASGIFLLEKNTFEWHVAGENSCTIWCFLT